MIVSVFKCAFDLFLQACTSAFATKDRLRSHMIRHEGKVTCNICGKMLSAAYITSHLKTHGQASFTSPCNKGMTIHLHLFQKQINWLFVRTNLGDSKLKCIYFLSPDSNNMCNSVTPVTASSAANTTAMNRGIVSNPITIAAQMNITTNTVNITSPVSLHHPVSISGPVNIASINIPTNTPMNIAHPVAITSPMSMNITGPLNIAMRSMDSMPFLSQVLPSSPPW